MDFSEQAVLVTGGASGIGRACALRFAAAGAHVMVADWNAEGAQATADEISSQGGQAAALTVDVSEGEAVRQMVAATVERFGPLKAAVNSAGVSGNMLASVLDADEDDFDRVIRVNLKGTWLCMKHEIAALLAGGGGAIVNLASVAGLIGAPGGAGYAASKHGVVGLTRSVALEMAQQNIRINAVCPSYIDTPMVRAITDINPKMERRTLGASPMKRLGTPEEVAETVVWLCSPAASFVNGAALAVDGGFTAS